MRLTRRDLLVGAAASTALACGSGESNAGDAAVEGCTEPSTGSAAPYCLVQAKRVRVAGAASLTAGQSLLVNVDDTTAVIVARDTQGFHALSAICPHACCLVSLCRDAGCTTLSPSPPACGATGVAEADPSAPSLVCPCHGSSFRLSDGAALTGPATSPLPAYAIAVEGSDAIVDTGVSVDPAQRV